ncbi:MAG: tetratricopeptide repeat protein [bacterium]|nr:tetratricopeptide repeat protein [bacterium]
MRIEVVHRTTKIILFLVLLFLLVGCSPQYQAEKAFYRAVKYSDDIFKDPKNIPLYKFEKACKDFQEIIDKYPQTVQGVETHFLLGNLYIIRGNYDKAIAVFEQISEHYHDNEEILAKAVVSVAGCYEKKGEWSVAVKKYREAFSLYPHSRSALNVPLYLYELYKAKNNRELTAIAYRRAVLDYKNIIIKNKDTDLAYSASNMLTELYMREGNWAEMMATLNNLWKTYPKSPDVPTWLMTMGATYDVKLRDKVKAREMYQTVKDHYSQSPWAKEAITRLQTLK